MSKPPGNVRPVRAVPPFASLIFDRTVRPCGGGGKLTAYTMRGGVPGETASGCNLLPAVPAFAPEGLNVRPSPSVRLLWACSAAAPPSLP
jgi:hypothetical protein